MLANIFSTFLIKNIIYMHNETECANKRSLIKITQSKT